MMRIEKATEFQMEVDAASRFLETAISHAEPLPLSKSTPDTVLYLNGDGARIEFNAVQAIGFKSSALREIAVSLGNGGQAGGALAIVQKTRRGSQPGACDAERTGAADRRCERHEIRVSRRFGGSFIMVAELECAAAPARRRAVHHLGAAGWCCLFSEGFCTPRPGKCQGAAAHELKTSKQVRIRQLVTSWSSPVPSGLPSFPKVRMITPLASAFTS